MSTEIVSLHFSLELSRDAPVKIKDILRNTGTRRKHHTMENKISTLQRQLPVLQLQVNGYTKNWIL